MPTVVTNRMKVSLTTTYGPQAQVVANAKSLAPATPTPAQQAAAIVSISEAANAALQRAETSASTSKLTKWTDTVINSVFLSGVQSRLQNLIYRESYSSLGKFLGN